MRIVAIITSTGPVRTGWSHGFRVTVNGKLVEVVTRTWLEHTQSGWLYQGLRLEAVTTGENLEEAMARLYYAADIVLGVVSAAAAAETAAVRLQLLYGDPAVGERGEMIVYSPTRHSEMKLHKAMWSYIEPIFLGLATADQSTSERIDRALRWYRAGVIEQDPVDRFAAFWIGLESLNVLLERKWQMERPDRTCASCGAVVGAQHGLLGVERLLREMPEAGHQTERRIRRLRNKLLHAADDVRSLSSEAAELADVVAIAILRGIAQLFDWAKDRENNFARPPLPPPQPFGSQARFEFTRVGEGSLGCEGYHPFAVLRTNEEIVHEPDGSPLRPIYTAHLTITSSAVVELHPNTIRVYLPRRVGEPLPVPRVHVSQAFACEDVKNVGGHGVSLWELGSTDTWWPDLRRGAQ